jgi:hypothetical protein
MISYSSNQISRIAPHYQYFFQSYIWNKIATERMSRWGMRPEIGDLYIDKETKSDSEDGVAEDSVKVVTDATNVSIYQIVLPVRFSCSL